MKLLHIVGRQDNGKTTLICELVGELTRRGLRVGTVKHSGHAHELDTPGKDSYRHRQSGGAPAAIVTTNLVAAFMPRGAGEDPYERLAPLFAACDLVLVEGDIDRPALKVEVWRGALETPPLALERRDLAALITDDPVEVSIPVWPRRSVPALADRVLRLLRVG